MEKTRTMRHTKSQMEILGLAIVVLLLILGMVFAIKFIAKKDPAALKKQVTESRVSSNYLSTYLGTSVPECNFISITDLLKDCAERGGISCQDGTLSCEKAKDVATIIFSRTFDEWKDSYNLTASLPGQMPLMMVGKGCESGQWKSKTFPLSTKAGTLSVRLDLCS